MNTSVKLNVLCGSRFVSEPTTFKAPPQRTQSYTEDKHRGSTTDRSLQRVQIRQQIIDLLISQHVSEALHFVSTDANNVADTIIIGRHATR